MQRITTTLRVSSRSVQVLPRIVPLAVRSNVQLVRWNSSNATNPPSSPSSSKPAGRTFNPDWSAPVVTYEEIKKRVRAPQEGTYLIDVREKDEVAQGMIPTAVNIPLSGFIESIRASPDEFRKMHGFTKPRQDQEIVFYCRSGKRSATACDSAKDNGFTNIKNYSGSWLDWVKKTQEKDYNID